MSYAAAAAKGPKQSPEEVCSSTKYMQIEFANMRIRRMSDNFPPPLDMCRGVLAHTLCL